MIEFKRVNKYYGSHHVLRDINMTVSRGEVVVVCGPSGSGKSTLIKCVNALEPYQHGHILVDGIDVGSKARSATHLRRRVGMVFQNFELYPHLSVIDNICLAQRVVLKRGDEEARERARRLLDRVGLKDKEAVYPTNLSGGQQQRVAIARALAQRPKLILADEPVASLDPKIARQVLDYLKDVSQRLGISVICNLHQIDFAREYAERIIGLSQGRLIFDGPPSALTDDIINQIYGSRTERAVE